MRLGDYMKSSSPAAGDESLRRISISLHAGALILTTPSADTRLAKEPVLCRGNPSAWGRIPRPKRQGPQPVRITCGKGRELLGTWFTQASTCWPPEERRMG